MIFSCRNSASKSSRRPQPSSVPALLVFGLYALGNLVTYVGAQDVKASELPKKMVSTAWYAGWHAADFPISQIPWSKYTEITYAFAITTPDNSVLSLGPPDEALIRELVASAHQHNVKAAVSIGGWTGSGYFSSHLATPANRTAFVRAVNNMVQKYNLDGVDFDWEYPGVQGIGCNVVSPNDTPNFLSFLKELRATPTGANLTISAATYVLPFVDATGNPSTNVAEFASVFDYIAIMNYDMKSRPSSGAGPNAPIDDSCAPQEARTGSATSAVKAWTKAGFPANQIVLGVPAYGRARFVTTADALPEKPDKLTAFPRYSPDKLPVGDKWDSTGGLDTCGVHQGPGGVFSYGGMIDEGFLKLDGSIGGGIIYRWDECSKTPFAYNPGTQLLVSYDNAKSFAAKGAFIKNEGLLGFAIWEAAGDYKNTLVNAILNATIHAAPLPKPASAGSDGPTSSAIPSRLSAAPPLSLYHTIIPLLALVSFIF